MYGGAGKHGRGGGRGAGAVRRNSTPLPSFHHQTQPVHRPSSSSGRLSNSAPRNRPPTAVATSSAPAAAVEETFSLVRGNPLDFAMIIRLAPDLVDEIKRAEEQGGGARIKFDTNANNTSGNVIDVGGKNFRFTWSREVGDLCDIYEERQSGEDGDGLLIESGCAWRKLNVQRVLDESTKNHVKKRSEEAERQQKSRKAIVLDPGNPSMKTQMKALAAAETTPWRKSFQQKKEPEFKKRKIETPPVAIGGPPKPVYKSGFPSTTSVSGRPSISTSPPSHSGAPASPSLTGIMTKGYTSAEDLSNRAMIKENTLSMEKEKHINPSTSTIRDKTRRKVNLVANSMDLRSLLIFLLKENPKGMSLKALEKAIGDAIPNSVKKIEPFIKKIATFQAPGRYILKPEVESEHLKNSLSECGRSPEDYGQQTPATEDKHEDATASTPNFAQKTSISELENQTIQNRDVGQEINSFDRIDSEHHSVDLFGDKKLSDNSEGPARSSSDSDSASDSESDSSGSGSDDRSHSRSRSKSKSPVRSGSGSSSDSDSDASSNSKQGPDEDVDIMTSDDDVSKPKTQTSDPKFSASPVSLWAREVEPIQNGIEEKQDISGSDLVDIGRDVPDDVHQARMDVVDSDKDVHTGHMFSATADNANNESKHDRTRNPERTSKGKPKRGSDSKQPHEKSRHAKRLKAANLPQAQSSPLMDPLLLGSSQKVASDRVVEDPYKGRSSQVINKPLKDGNIDSGFRKGDSQRSNGKSSMDYQNQGRRPSELSGRARAIDTAERPGVAPESLGHSIDNSKKNNQAQERTPFQKDKVNLEIQEDNLHNKEKKSLRNYKGNILNDTSAVNIGRGKMLQRELSDLELGEFRETLPEETPGVKRFERESSFKESENRPRTSDFWTSELSKGKPTISAGGPVNTEGPPKRAPEYHPEDLTRPSNRVLQSQPKGAENLSRVELSEAGRRKPGDVNSKLRHNEGRGNQENGVDGLRDEHMKAVSQQHDIARGPVSHPKRDSQMHNINSVPDLSEIKKDVSLTESSEGVIKRRESSSDENSCSYSKYEKDEPELKGPIKDFSQYKDFVQEYQEKYDSYCSLNKTLESYRNEFCKLGKDLENAKGRNMEKYYQILEQLQESYRQCGSKHKRLKKIFVVLHEELKHLKQAIQDYAASYTRE